MCTCVPLRMMSDELRSERHASLRAYLRRLEENIVQVQHRLGNFERTYGEDTETIFARIRDGELEMREEFEDWAGEREMLRRLLEQKNELEARLS